MKKFTKVLTTLSLAVIMALSAAMPASAHEVYDEQDSGILVTIPEGRGEIIILDDLEPEGRRGTIFPAVPVGWGFEMPTFDNPIDYVYWSVFGDGFEFMQNASVNINRTINHGNLQLRVLSSVAIAGQTFTQIVWPENVIQIFDEETGIWQMICDDTGEVIDWEDLEHVEATDLTVYTFLSLRDTTGEISMASTQLSLEQDLGAVITAGEGFFFGHIRFGHYDEENDTAYFAAVHSTHVENPGRTMPISFTIDHILAGEQHYSDEIKIDLAALLDSHQATFIVEDYESDPFGRTFSRSGSTAGEIHEILGADFDPLRMDAEIMARGELNIHIAHDIYLTNIAFRDNLLLLQIRQEDNIWRFPQDRWAHFGDMVDTRTGPLDWVELTAEIDFLTMDPDEFEAWDEKLRLIWSSRYINNLYSIDVSLFDDDFQIIGNRRYTEMAFHIEDMELINYLAFNVFGGHFEVVQPVNFNISHRRVPVIGGSVTIDAAIELMIAGTRYTASDFTLSPMEISFAIDNGQSLLDALDDFTRRFSIGDYIQIELIYADGTESEFPANQFSWSSSWNWLEEDEEDELVEVRLILFGGVVDIDNLVAIRVNGERIDRQ